MKKSTVICLAVLSIAVFGCSSRTVEDPITGERVPNNLKDLLMGILEKAPGDPWNPRDQFDPTEVHGEKLFEQSVLYLTKAGDYYGRIEAQIFYIVHELKEEEDLGSFNADEGYYEIPFRMSTAHRLSDDENYGPDFHLYVPQENSVVEKLHLFNENLQTKDEWFEGEGGGLAALIFYAYMDVENAETFWDVWKSEDVYLRIGVQFDFPSDILEEFQGYRFIPDRYDILREAYDEKKANLDSLRISIAKEEDLVYAAGDGKIIVKIVSVELVDKEGIFYHRWPFGLELVQTPTPIPTEGPTPLPTVTFEPTATLLTSTPSAGETEEPFCPGAMLMRMEVGKGGRVTEGPPVGDPREVRLRVQPSTSAPVSSLLPLKTEFMVVGGPKCSDGFVWWQINVLGYSGYWVAEGENNNYHIEPWGN